VITLSCHVVMDKDLCKFYWWYVLWIFKFTLSYRILLFKFRKWRFKTK